METVHYPDLNLESYKGSYLFLNYGVIPSKYDLIKEPTVFHGTFENPVDLVQHLCQKEQHDKYVGFVDSYMSFLGVKRIQEK